MISMFALADCNNFYVSCERIFHPELINKPVLVLSNNDGCVIARSNEVKEMGIPMGAPYFKIKNYVKQHDIQVFSSNYTLYGEMSARVMRILQQFTSHFEVYSIDEAFLDLSAVPKDELLNYAEHIRQTVNQWTGIPISIGIGPTKTLAKVANKTAKARKVGSYALIEPEGTKMVLKDFPLKDIWGVGRKWAEKLQQRGIYTALDISLSAQSQIRKSFNVILARTSLELSGVSVLKLEEVSPSKKNIVSSRSFGREVTSLQELSEAVAYHAGLVGEKLRKQNSCAVVMGCFISTSAFKGDEQKYRAFYPYTLPVPSQDTAVLIHYSLNALKQIYKEGYRYIKAGVMVVELVPTSHVTVSLFENRERAANRKKLMKTMDQINSKYGRGALTFASEGIQKSWRMKRRYKSQDYLTRWDQVLCVS